MREAFGKLKILLAALAAVTASSCSLLNGGGTPSFDSTSQQGLVSGGNGTSLAVSGSGGNGIPYQGYEQSAHRVALYERSPAYACGGTTIGYSSLALLDPTSLSTMIAPDSCQTASTSPADPSSLVLSTVSGRYLGYENQIYEALPTTSSASSLAQPGNYTNAAWCSGTDSAQDSVEVAIQFANGSGSPSAVVYLARPYNNATDGTPPAGTLYSQWRGQTPVFPVQAQNSGSTWKFGAGPAFNLSITSASSLGGQLQAVLNGVTYQFPLTCLAPALTFAGPPQPTPVSLVGCAQGGDSNVFGDAIPLAAGTTNGNMVVVGMSAGLQITPPSGYATNYTNANEFGVYTHVYQTGDSATPQFSYQFTTNANWITCSYSNIAGIDGATGATGITGTFLSSANGTGLTTSSAGEILVSLYAGNNFDGPVVSIAYPGSLVQESAINTGWTYFFYADEVIAAPGTLTGTMTATTNLPISGLNGAQILLIPN